jgi:hypothetical protein
VRGLTLIGWFPRTTAALLLVSDNHLLVAKLILATAVSSWQMCSSRTVVIGSDIHMVRLLQAALRVERTAGPERQAAQNP